MSLHHELLRSRLPTHPPAWTRDGEEDDVETLEDDEARDTVATSVGLP